MSRNIGLTRRTWNFVKHSLFRIPPPDIYVIGEDHLGNRYFEKPKEGYKPRRWVESPGGEATVEDVPLEWTSWLRHTRKEPPSQEEIDRNYATMMRTQYRAKEIEERNIKESESTGGITRSVSGSSGKSKFPTYDDYEITPGKKR